MTIGISIIFQIVLCCAVPLHAAYSKQYIRAVIKIGNITTLHKIIKDKNDLEDQHFEMYTPLALAVRFRQPAIVDYLLARGADIHGNTEYTPLSQAIDPLLPQIDLARTLIAHGAYDFSNIQVRYAARHAPDIALLLLIDQTRQEIQPSDDMLEWLNLQLGPPHDINFLTWWKRQDPKRLAIETKINYIYSLCGRRILPTSSRDWDFNDSLEEIRRETAKWYMERVSSKKMDQRINGDKLRRAILSGKQRIKTIRRLVTSDMVDINDPDTSDRTPLMWALKAMHQKSLLAVQELLDLGADPNAKNKEQHTALSLCKHVDCARELIAYGAHDSDNRALSNAAMIGAHQIALLLLIHKENRELQPSDDMLAWLTQIFGNDDQAIEFLRWWKSQDPVNLAIETKINRIYSLCAQPNNPE